MPEADQGGFLLSELPSHACVFLTSEAPKVVPDIPRDVFPPDPFYLREDHLPSGRKTQVTWYC